MGNGTVATYAGRGIIWNRLKGSGTEPLNIGWGTTALTGSSNWNVNLFGPQTETRTAGTSSILTTAQLGDTYQVVGTIVCAVGAKSIQEAGLFDFKGAANSPTTTISNSLTAATTTFVLGAIIFPTSGNFYAQLENETVLVTGAPSATLAVTRGVLGSTSAVHSAGVPFTTGGDGGAGGWTTGQTAAGISGTYGGNMFIHSDFGSISLNVNDSISFTFSDTLT